jgi:all-trans-8'-apo-beta-carotenal 15,15'-oxygenase
MNRRSFLTAAAGVAALALNPDVLYAASAGAGDWTLGFADVEADIAPRGMSLVDGKPPADLAGVLYRNGPAKFHRPGGSVGHWFDGDGMVRRFGLNDGKATLSARFVDTPKRRADTAANAVVTAGFGTAPGKGAGVQSADAVNAANISVMMAGDDLWALWESGSPVVMDPDTLETRGFKTLGPNLKGMPFLAHPRFEPDGTVWNLGVAGHKAVVWTLNPVGDLRSAAMIDLPRASYLHDFTATARHLVIVLQPWIQTRFITPVVDGYSWQPGLGTQILVIDKADLTKRRVYETETFSFFHMGDAWEEADGTIRFDICTDPDPSFGIEGGRALMQGRRPAASARPSLALIGLHPDGKTSLERPGVVAEFPKSDPRFAGLARRFSAGLGDGPGDNPMFQSVVVRDWKRDRVEQFDFGDRFLAEEVVFVPRPGGSAEFDGWLVGTGVNLDVRATELHVFDARRVAAGPVARWRADVVLPVSLHGVFKEA